MMRGTMFFNSFKKIKLILLLALTCCGFNRVLSQGSSSNDESYHMFLTGNTADVYPGSNFFDHLKTLIERQTSPFCVIINGDLVSGPVTDTDTMNLVKLIKSMDGITDGNMIILPGDRDWANSGAQGWEQVLKLEQFIKSFRLANVKWSPSKGCPGPNLIALNKYVNLVVINTQWANHPFAKPNSIYGDCDISSEHLFIEELDDILTKSKNKNVLVAGHYPLVSFGKYGGRYPLKSHLLPFPLIGSMLISYHRNIGNAKDISNSNFDGFRKRLLGTLRTHKSLIYASGHERNIQILYDKGNYAINSGVPDKDGWCSNSRYACYADGASGLVELIYYPNGRVEAKVLNTDDNGFIAGYHRTLFQSDCEPDSAEIPTNTSISNCPDEEIPTLIVSGMFSQRKDSNITVGGAEYKAGFGKRLYLGAHYRTSWTTEITAPYLDLEKTFGGLDPYKVGGGRQTQALKFKANNGKIYTFRSVNKDPSKALVPALRETFLLPLFKDQISTQHPYGAVAVNVLLNATDILHVSPKIYLLRDESSLGPFQDQFGGMLGMLEESPKRSFSGSNKVSSSHKVFKYLYEDHNNKVDAKAFAEARIFDIFIGDWSRHADNWKWAGYSLDNGIIFKPIPRDRDHSFSRWDGILPWLTDRRWGLGTVENFDYKIKDVRSLTAQAVHLDRMMISELTREERMCYAADLQKRMSDSVIEVAIRAMPAETYELSGREIEAKLKSRIKRLDKDILDYYLLQAEFVDILGSNKQEYFEIQRNSDGTVDVWMHNVINTKSKGPTQLYHRKFNPKETKEIRLFGLGNDDIFSINGTAKSSILVRIIGGKGAELIEDKSSVSGSGRKTLIYEKDKASQLNTGSEAKQMNRSHKSAYDFERAAFSYKTYLPLPVIGYSSDKGLQLGAGIQLKRQRYGKPGYSSKHKFYLAGSSEGNFKFEYQSKYHYVFGGWNFMVNGLVATPDDINFFYGVGNKTVKDEELFNADYYKTRNELYKGVLTLEKEFWKHSTFTIAMQYENNNAEIGDSTILVDQPTIFGAGDVTLAGGVAALDIDFRDNRGFPENGMRVFAQFESGTVLSNSNSLYGLTMMSIEYYVSIKGIFRPTLGLKLGGGTSYGEIPFYKQHHMGQDSYLHGYRRNRFTGDGIAFFTSELRLPIFRFKTKIAPFKYGLIGFNDVGRVFQDGEQSATWHHGYGVGFYLIPLTRRFAFSFSIGFSEEEESGLLLLNFGTLLN